MVFPVVEVVIEGIVVVVGVVMSSAIVLVSAVTGVGMGTVVVIAAVTGSVAVIGPVAIKAELVGDVEVLEVMEPDVKETAGDADDVIGSKAAEQDILVTILKFMMCEMKLLDSTPPPPTSTVSPRSLWVVVGKSILANT